MAGGVGCDAVVGCIQHVVRIHLVSEVLSCCAAVIEPEVTQEPHIGAAGDHVPTAFIQRRLRERTVPDTNVVDHGRIRPTARRRANCQHTVALQRRYVRVVACFRQIQRVNTDSVDIQHQLRVRCIPCPRQVRPRVIDHYSSRFRAVCDRCAVKRRERDIRHTGIHAEAEGRASYDILPDDLARLRSSIRRLEPGFDSP